MKKVLAFFLIGISSQIVTAQYTDIINSKRPGFSESPYGIGKNVYQIETDFFYRSSDNLSYYDKPSTFGSSINIRVGQFLEKMEMNANISYQNDEIRAIAGKNYNKYGISDVSFGVKYLVFQQDYTDKTKEIRSWKKRTSYDSKRYIPSVGIYAGIHTNFLVDDTFLQKDAFIEGNSYEDGMSYKGALLLQNDFTDRFVVLTNLIADRITTANEFYTYILTATYAVNQNWSFFAENQGKYKKNYSPEYQIGAGLAYLISPNLQVDISARTNFFDNYSYVYASTGIAWRLDKHKDEPLKNEMPKAKKLKKNKKSAMKRLLQKKYKKKKL